jgi:type II secretory pathway pseudopilin PulG
MIPPSLRCRPITVPSPHSREGGWGQGPPQPEHEAVLERSLGSWAQGGRPDGFTLTEIMLVGGLMSLLGLLISGAWQGLGRSSTDAVVRCRVAQQANLAVESLARDLGGSLAGQVTGEKQLGRLVGRLVVSGSQLWLCFDGGPPDGVANWAPPDTVIIYEVQGNQLIRSQQGTGVAVAVANNLSQMQLTEQVDGVKIDLRLQYRNLTRTYTLVAKDP